MASKRERSSSLEDTTDPNTTIKRSKTDDADDDKGEEGGVPEAAAVSPGTSGVVQQAPATLTDELTGEAEIGVAMEEGRERKEGAEAEVREGVAVEENADVAEEVDVEVREDTEVEAEEPEVEQVANQAVSALQPQPQPQSPSQSEAPQIRTPPSILRRRPPHTVLPSPSGDTSLTSPTRTPSSVRSVRINLDTNTFLSAFSCVCCGESFGTDGVTTLSCGHYLCIHCAIEVNDGEGEGLESCIECSHSADEAEELKEGGQEKKDLGDLE